MTLEALTAMNAVQITESDSTIYDPPLKMFIVIPDGVGGTITWKNEKDESIVITVPATLTNTILLPGRVRRVMATGTTYNDAYIIGVR